MISLSTCGMAHVQRVAGAGVIHVITRIVASDDSKRELSMPLKLSVGPSWLPSAVWLYTTSRITSMPARCSVLTMFLNSPTCVAAVSSA